MFKVIAIVVTLHCIGDYFLQTDFLARTKSTNYWHLMVHCILYTVPFGLYFGMTKELVWLFTSHLAIDFLKCKNKIVYVDDQVLHLIIACALYYGLVA